MKRSYTLSPFPDLVNEWVADNERKQALADIEKRKPSVKAQLLQMEKSIREAYDPDITRWGFYIELLTTTGVGIVCYAVFALLMCVLQ